MYPLLFGKNVKQFFNFQISAKHNINYLVKQIFVYKNYYKSSFNNYLQKIMNQLFTKQL